MKKKYTMKDIKEKYWEFQKEINTHDTSYGNFSGGNLGGWTYGFAGGGGGGCSEEETYKDNSESFIRWLENK